MITVCEPVDKIRYRDTTIGLMHLRSSTEPNLFSGDNVSLSDEARGGGTKYEAR